MYALIAHLIISLFIQPFAFSQMRGEILKVRTDIASQMVRAGEFVTPTIGLTVFAREISSDGGMKDVIIYDTRDDSGATTHTAKTGYLARSDESASLVLKDGSLQQILKDGSIELVAFDDYQLDLSDVMAMDSTRRTQTYGLRPQNCDLCGNRILHPFGGFWPCLRRRKRPKLKPRSICFAAFGLHIMRALSITKKTYSRR